jgi:3'-phosphoadenosine 5'-phosphosulfate (PAPS) 3'-phosphatase
MSINTRELTEVCLQLCQEACKIVKDSYMNKDVKKFTKEIGDPVTEADLKIQTLIVRGLKLFFPELPIVGEEEVEFKK